jgi:hypothetical protein
MFSRSIAALYVIAEDKGQSSINWIVGQTGTKVNNRETGYLVNN